MMFQKTGIAAWVAIAMMPLAAAAKTIGVDCNDGQTIQQRLRHAEPGDRVVVSGTCNENVRVEEDRVSITLDGQGTAVVNGPDPGQATLHVGGRNITIRGFAVRGGQDGIAVRDGGTAVIDGNTIEGTGEDGISVSRHSSARIVNNTVRNNPRDGVIVNDGSNGLVGVLTGKDTVASPNVITSNGRRGVTVVRSSDARVIGNTIAGNAENGVHIARDAQADAAGNAIDGNGGHGVLVTQNSGANLSDNNDAPAIFSAPNAGSNGRFGIQCSVGAYVSGIRGGLTGASGVINAVQGCVNDSAP